MTNDERRQILNRAKALNYPGSILEVFQAYSQGIDVLSDFEREQRAMQNQQAPIVAQTPQEQSQGLIPFHQQGMTNQSMVFPDVKPGQPFTTKGLTAPIDMTKVDNQGNVVESYKSVQPGIANIPTGPYEGTMIETPAKSYLKGGFIKKYQLAGPKPEEDSDVIYNDVQSFYGQNKGDIQKKKDISTSNIPTELIDKLSTLQSQINEESVSPNSRKAYEERISKAIDKLGVDQTDVSKLGYVPQNVIDAAWKENPLQGPNYCISGVCYTLNEAGEPIKYYSNSKLQEDIQKGNLQDWQLNFDTKQISGGDIVQFTGEKGRPHHAGLVVPGSIRKQEDGTILFDAYMNTGDGSMHIRKDYKLDPSKDRVETGYGSETVQLVSKKLNSNLSNLVNERDTLRKQIQSYDPSYFETKDKTIRYNTYSPDQIEERFTGIEGRDDILTRIGGGDEIDAAGRLLGKNRKYSELSEKAQFKSILSEVNNPEFKKSFMAQYNLTNQEYNAAVMTALGVYGQETKFGTASNKVVENDLVRGLGKRGKNLVNILSGKEKVSTDKEDFSRGLTQVKLRNISKEDRAKYNINAKNLDSDPNAAIKAAMIVNAQNMPTLRKIAADGRNASVTEENYLDYLPYLYNQRSAILSGDEKNIKKAKAKGRSGKVAEKAVIIHPDSPEANNEYVKRVRAFSKLFEVVPSDVAPAVISKKKGGTKCYTCGGLKAKVGYNKLDYKK